MQKFMPFQYVASGLAVGNRVADLLLAFVAIVPLHRWGVPFESTLEEHFS